MTETRLAHNPQVSRNERSFLPVIASAGIVLFLFLLNGFFAMAELAIVSARRARLRQMAEDEKSKGAERALALAEDTTSFLSVVQIGMTLISVSAGAFSGATVAEPFGDYLNGIDGIAPHGHKLALAITVVGVTYFNLVIGELIPKRIGLAYAESIAVRVSWFMRFLAKLVAPIVWVLRLSTDVLLRLMRLDASNVTPVTEEEVKDMIAEGTQTGVFKPAEKNMLEGVMRLADRSVRTLMTPRVDMVWLCLDDEADEQTRIMRESGYSRFPVAKGDMEEVVGIVHAKDLLNAAMRGENLDVAALMRPPFFVPDSTPVLRLLDHFRQSGQHIAVVIDEYGSVEGLVTLKDVLEAIIGDLPEIGQDSDDKPVRRADGSWLIDGMMPIDEVETLIGVKNMRDGGEFHTIAGFMIDKLGRIPTAGDAFHWGDARFEVVDMDARRVDKVLVMPPVRADDGDAEID